MWTTTTVTNQVRPTSLMLAAARSSLPINTPFNRGFHISGDLSRHVRIRRFVPDIRPGISEFPLPIGIHRFRNFAIVSHRMHLNSVTNQELSTLSARWEQEIELFNYDSGQFESVDTRLTSSMDTVVSVTPSGDPARFVEAGTNAMQARISYQNSLPFWVFSTQNLYLPYRVRADHIFWTITP